MGNRIGKRERTATGVTSTWYVLDAQARQCLNLLFQQDLAIPVPIFYNGSNAMATYSDSRGANFTALIRLSEHPIYGSSRLGSYQSGRIVYPRPENQGPYIYQPGLKQYELSNHLGNVLATVSDIKQGVDSDVVPDGTIDFERSVVKTQQSYYPFGMLQPEMSYTMGGSKYKFGFNGMEKDNEVKGSGNSVNMGNRMLDTRLGRTFKIDVKTSSYPDISPYSYAANNPIIFVDPDGMDIKLAKGLTQAQKMEIVGTLQKLTNDKLVYKTLKDDSVQIKIASLAESGKKTKITGTNLLRELNSSERTVTIDYKNSMGTFSTDGGNKAKASDYTKAADGTGSDATVSFDPDSDPDIMTVDPKTGNSTGQKRPNKIGLGHELIHAEHYMEGSYSPSDEKASHTFQMDGKPVTETYEKEELRTVGLAGNKKGDHTENQLRKENGQKQRGSYQTYK